MSDIGKLHHACLTVLMICFAPQVVAATTPCCKGYADAHAMPDHGMAPLHLSDVMRSVVRRESSTACEEWDWISAEFQIGATMATQEVVFRESLQEREKAGNADTDLEASQSTHPFRSLMTDERVVHFDLADGHLSDTWALQWTSEQLAGPLPREWPVVSTTVEEDGQTSGIPVALAAPGVAWLLALGGNLLSLGRR